MELILLILKIILIAFFVVLGLILLALGLILFVPIRYEASGSIGDSWEIRVKGKVTYLLSIIKLLFSYEEEQFDMKLFLFGFEKKLEQTENEEEDEATDEVSDNQEAGKAQELTKEAEITFHEKKSTSVPAQEDVKTSEVTEKSEPVEAKSKEPVSKDSKPKKEKKESKFDFAFIKEQLTDEHNKSVVRKICSEFVYLLKHFKFRKIETDLVFATGDPATTGQVLGILCMIPTLYRYDFKIVPDFEAEEPYAKGTFLVAGKVRLIHILLTALRLIFDKEVRLVVKRILRLLER